MRQTTRHLLLRITLAIAFACGAANSSFAESDSHAADPGSHSVESEARIATLEARVAELEALVHELLHDHGPAIEADAVDAERVFQALPDGVAWTQVDIERVHEDEQVRLWWGRTPVDLFFRASAFHDAAADRAELQPFGAHRLPFLAAQDLVVFKSLFDRPKDWVDIAAMHAAGAFDVEAAVSALRSLVGHDPRVDQLLRVVSNAR